MFLWSIALCIPIGACITGAVFFFATHAVIDFSVFESNAHGISSVVLDDTGQELMRFQLDRKEPVSFSELPPHLINAFLTAEDRTFFQHRGISWRGIIRSFFVNCYHRRSVQGASTITQQLVKLLLLHSRKTFTRKIKEQCYAVLVERQFSKEQILEAYLNNIYFGCGIYGVEAASQRFWGKHARDVTIDEAAILAAVIRSPGNYSPLLCPLSNQRLRDSILNSMHKLRMITDNEYEHAIAAPLAVQAAVHDVLTTKCGLHIREVLRRQLEHMVGRRELYTQGFVIKTTLNRKAQEAAELVFRKHCGKIRELLHCEADGGLLSMDTATGGIKAAVGGYDYAVSQFNRAFQARRQIGSLFKPIVYAAAVQSGIRMSETRLDEPLELQMSSNQSTNQDNNNSGLNQDPDLQKNTQNSSQKNACTWIPKNYHDQFEGEITLAYALSRSNNIVAIKTFLEVGAEPIIDLAKRCYFKGPFYPYPSLALGCVDATLPEVLGAFNIFANGGAYVKPHLITWIKDRWGVKILKQQKTVESVLDSRISGSIGSVLQVGLARACRRLGNGALIDSEGMSKTGTTNDSRTCWFVGATPSLATAVYIGCDDNRSLGKNVFPSTTAFPIWLGYHRLVPSRIKQFTYDPRLRVVTLNERTGLPINCSSGDERGAITFRV